MFLISWEKKNPSRTHKAFCLPCLSKCGWFNLNEILIRKILPRSSPDLNIYRYVKNLHKLWGLIWIASLDLSPGGTIRRDLLMVQIPPPPPLHPPATVVGWTKDVDEKLLWAGSPLFQWQHFVQIHLSGLWASPSYCVMQVGNSWPMLAHYLKHTHFRGSMIRWKSYRSNREWKC